MPLVQRDVDVDSLEAVNVDGSGTVEADKLETVGADGSKGTAFGSIPVDRFVESCVYR